MLITRTRILSSSSSNLQNLQLCSFIHSHLNSIISDEGRQRFHDAVKHDQGWIPELNVRQGEPKIDEEASTTEKRTFKAGEASTTRSPYFGKKSKGDSAVLVPMINMPAKESPSNEAESITQPWFLLTHRSYELRSHRGEICFPGGKIENNEPVEEAALRESYEEISLPPTAVTIWSQLQPVLTRSLKNNVIPVVGVVDNAILQHLQPRDDEVQTIFLVPLSDLIASRQYTAFKVPKFKYTLPVFFSTNYQIIAETSKAYRFPDHRIRIWGLTGVMANQTIGCLLPDEVFPKRYI